MIPIGDERKLRRKPLVNWSLLLVNIGAFVIMCLSSSLSYFISRYGFATERALENPKYLATVLTAMFIHSSPFHLIGNMFYLYIFGDDVEDYLGHWMYLVFYLFSGICAAFLHMLFTLSPPGSRIPAVGASGAISGVLGAYLVFYPNARIKVFILCWYPLFMRISAKIFILLWFVYQLVMSLWVLTGGVSSVAWFAHIGGFAAGYIAGLAIKQYRRRVRRRHILKHFSSQGIQ